jgi:hypothetical protein
MGSVIILEGPDGSGKTTLANALVKMGFEYRHEGPSPKKIDLVDYYLKTLNNAIESQTDTVLDRFWLGERIYGPIARGSDRLGDRGQTLFLRLHNSKQVKQYICLPSLKAARQNYAKKIVEKSDYLGNLDMWGQTFKSYREWLDKYGNDSDLYDYEKNTPDQVYQQAKLYSLSPLPAGTIGSRKAEYLFIGDRPNHDFIDIPFFALTGSSGYLNSALVSAGLDEGSIALSNAYSPESRQHSLVDILESLPGLKAVFLMGYRAREWWRMQTQLNPVSHLITCQVPHPSYLRRFKGHDPQVLAGIIKEKLNGLSN